MRTDKLTKAKAEEEVQNIKEMQGDYEAAHNAEDYLYTWFVQCCTEELYDDKEEIEQVAASLLKTQLMSFPRYSG